jgi:hypothetical protein
LEDIYALRLVNLFGTPLKAPKTAFLHSQLIETIRTVDSNRNRQALRYPLRGKGNFIAETALLYLPLWVAFDSFG